MTGGFTLLDFAPLKSILNLWFRLWRLRSIVASLHWHSEGTPGPGGLGRFHGKGGGDLGEYAAALLFSRSSEITLSRLQLLPVASDHTLCYLFCKHTRPRSSVD